MTLSAMCSCVVMLTMSTPAFSAAAAVAPPPTEKLIALMMPVLSALTAMPFMLW